MGHVQSRFPRVLVTPRSDDLVQTLPLKHKAYESQDLNFLPPAKVARVLSEKPSFKLCKGQGALFPSADIVSPLVCEDRDFDPAPPEKVAHVILKVDNFANPLLSRRLECFILWLPNELLNLIAALLPQHSLLVLTQVCKLFTEIAAPHYFALLEFSIPQDNSLTLDTKGCEALLVWRRTDAFVVPKRIYFSTSRAADCHFHALRIFLQSLTDLNVPRVYIFTFSGPYEPTIAFLDLLETIHSECKELSCHGTGEGGSESQLGLAVRTPDCQSKLQVLEIATTLFFTPLSIAFTLSTLCNAPLTKLRLMNTGLTITEWMSFLKDLHLKHLRILEVEALCPVQGLVNFLSRHELDTLVISSSASIMDRLRPHLSPSWHTRSAIPLSLSRLEGCPSYIISLLRYADISNNLEYLGLWLGRSSLSNFFISDVLSCTEHFPALQDLFVHIPIGTDTHALAFPKHFQACFVKYLMLHIQDSDILSHYAQWLPAFLAIEALSLLSNGSRSDDDLEDFFWLFAPSNLRISIVRPYKYCEAV